MISEKASLLPKQQANFELGYYQEVFHRIVSDVSQFGTKQISISCYESLLLKQPFRSFLRYYANIL